MERDKEREMNLGFMALWESVWGNLDLGTFWMGLLRKALLALYSALAEWVQLL